MNSVLEVCDALKIFGSHRMTLSLVAIFPIVWNKSKFGLPCSILPTYRGELGFGSV
jgi:hypothetical protein